LTGELRLLRATYGWRIIAPILSSRLTMARCDVFRDLLPAIVAQLDGRVVLRVVGVGGVLVLQVVLHMDGIGNKRPVVYVSLVAFSLQADDLFRTHGSQSTVAPITLVAGKDTQCGPQYRQAVESLHLARNVRFKVRNQDCFVQFDIDHTWHSGDRAELVIVHGGMASSGRSAETFQVGTWRPTLFARKHAGGGGCTVQPPRAVARGHVLLRPAVLLLVL